mmetsp:Transcript_10992/g.15844  ORF Transcript_10992/g.15844 Transcript_10992/m.15844 type:complete len:495 (+) Transcript_10992:66-1550(+)|eukprot:CAMPEP_0172422138 /NCGR_PEP_ID=MMETSP1064-20121228/8328_1 /TAXON_ID=202472 /ORGANISM="Aulacoseira subarctica , Strain CCAP 1002/5" /LENGTH=494 /DNA_ID=CAMNT_0013162857 /DNA_START=42 /DNA_END=1526 /DNA_ORIENTATION=+
MMDSIKIITSSHHPSYQSISSSNYYQKDVDVARSVDEVLLYTTRSKGIAWMTDVRIGNSSFLAGALFAAVAGMLLIAARPFLYQELNMATMTAGSNFISLGPIPYFKLTQLVKNTKDKVNDEGPLDLQTTLVTCASQRAVFQSSDFVISSDNEGNTDRSNRMSFPSHTLPSYEAALRMGAGMVQCPVTFTKDRELVCRQQQCDLHISTDILYHQQPQLASKCAQPFIPSDGIHRPAQVKCCTSDFTLEELQMLNGRCNSNSANAAINIWAMTPFDYLGINTRTASSCVPANIPSHEDYIALVHSWGAKFAPIQVPFVYMDNIENYTQEMHSRQIIQSYSQGLVIDPSRIYPTSQNWEDIFLWKREFPQHARNAIAIDMFYEEEQDENILQERFTSLLGHGVSNVVTNDMWVLLKRNMESESIESFEPSVYAKVSKKMKLNIFTVWTESSSELRDETYFRVLHALNKQVGIKGIFADVSVVPTASFYMNCMSALE